MARRRLVCLACRYAGESRQVARGQGPSCPRCGGRLIPAGSPRGREMLSALLDGEHVVLETVAQLGEDGQCWRGSHLGGPDVKVRITDLRLSVLPVQHPGRLLLDAPFGEIAEATPMGLRVFRSVRIRLGSGRTFRLRPRYLRSVEIVELIETPGLRRRFDPGTLMEDGEIVCLDSTEADLEPAGREPAPRMGGELLLTSRRILVVRSYGKVLFELPIDRVTDVSGLRGGSGSSLISLGAAGRSYRLYVPTAGYDRVFAVIRAVTSGRGKT